MECKNIKFYEETELFDTLSNFTNKNIWIDPSITPYAIKHNSKAKTPAFMAKTCPLELPKSIKNKTEIKGAIEAHKKDGVALCKFLFKLDEKQIPKLEIPTGNPLHIELDKKLKITKCRYLDQERAQDLLVF